MKHRERTTALALALLALALPLLAAPAAQAGPVAGAELASRWLQDDDLERRGDAPARDLRVQVWHDREDDDPYDPGDALRVHFRTDSDVYVVVYRIDAEGYVDILWPTSRYDDGFVYGGHSYTVPRRGSPVGLRASRETGVEYIQAIASLYPFDLRELAIDFRFDPDAADLRYDYQVSGDPLLAVNDINYAITGLEEDADFLVTDFAHLYVGERVEYARYTCRQCHTADTHSYRPYVDSCSKVTVYTDWGWHRNWYVSFGWYPLYYESSYYYYDPVLCRPFYNWYYPVVYRWPSYHVYTRPYRFYDWRATQWYAGDYLVRYKRHQVRSAPLYDISSNLADARLRRESAGQRGNLPRSIATAMGLRGEERVRPERLVRDRIPDRERRELSLRGDSGRRDRQPGVRPGADRPTDRRIRAIAPERDRQRAREGGREWTRPVVRNRGGDRDNDRSGGEIRRPARREDDGRPRVRRDDRPTRRDDRKPPEVKRDRPTRRDDRKPPEVKRDRPTRRDDRKPPEVKRDRPTRRDDRKPPEVKRDRPTRRDDRKPPQVRRDRPQPRQDRKPPQVRRDRPQPRQDRKPPQVRRDRPQRQEERRAPQVRESRPERKPERRAPQVRESRPERRDTGKAPARKTSDRRGRGKGRGN